MPKPDLAPFAARVVAAVKSYVAKAEAGLSARLDALEARLKALPAPEKGERGEPGEQGPVGPAGKDADLAEIHTLVDARVTAVLTTLPQPKDGTPGRDGQPGAPGPAGRDGENGRDGFGLEDFDIELGEDGRTVSFRFVRGEVKVERQIRIPAMLYRGVWRDGEYEPGDVVTWGGSAWHCQKAGSDKPQQSDQWKLMVKEGRPGKDGKPPAPRETGPVRTG